MSALFEQLGVGISNQLVFKIVASVVVLLILWVLRGLASSLVKQRLSELARYHHWRRGIGYVHIATAAVLLSIIWIKGVKDVATFLGIMGAGIAVAMHDTIANLAGWIFIITRKPSGSETVSRLGRSLATLLIPGHFSLA